MGRWAQDRRMSYALSVRVEGIRHTYESPKTSNR